MVGGSWSLPPSSNHSSSREDRRRVSHVLVSNTFDSTFFAFRPLFRPLTFSGGFLKYLGKRARSVSRRSCPVTAGRLPGLSDEITRILTGHHRKVPRSLRIWLSKVPRILAERGHHLDSPGRPHSRVDEVPFGKKEGHADLQENLKTFHLCCQAIIRGSVCSGCIARTDAPSVEYTDLIVVRPRFRRYPHSLPLLFISPIGGKPNLQRYAHWSVQFE